MERSQIYPISGVVNEEHANLEQDHVIACPLEFYNVQLHRSRNLQAENADYAEDVSALSSDFINFKLKYLNADIFIK